MYAYMFEEYRNFIFTQGEDYILTLYYLYLKWSLIRYKFVDNCIIPMNEWKKKGSLTVYKLFDIFTVKTMIALAAGCLKKTNLKKREMQSFLFLPFIIIFKVFLNNNNNKKTRVIAVYISCITKNCICRYYTHVTKFS